MVKHLIEIRGMRAREKWNRPEDAKSNQEEFQLLAGFCMALRRFQCFSGQTSETLDLALQQYQRLWSIKVHTDEGAFTITELARQLLI